MISNIVIKGGNEKTVLKYFLPDQYLQSVYHLNLNDLRKKNIKGIITDLDNTLIEWDRPEATPELLDWFRLVEQQGFQVTIVSNNKKERVGKVCAQANIPFIHSARKPLRKAFIKAQKKMKLPKEQVIVIGDQVLTDIFGGNRAGFHTVLVVPVSSSDGFLTKINRKIERRVLKRLKEKGLIPWEESS